MSLLVSLFPGTSWRRKKRSSATQEIKQTTQLEMLLLTRDIEAELYFGQEYATWKRF